MPADQHFLHYSDVWFQPGDLLLPPTRTGVTSAYDGNRLYRADRVYLFDESAADDVGSHWFGIHAYVVQPLGPVAPDPEARHLDEFLAAEGLAWDSLDRERVRRRFMTPRARVSSWRASDWLFAEVAAHR